MKKITLLGCVIGCLSVITQLFGQDPNYSQFYHVPSFYNPAYTGLYTGMRFNFAFRDQWPSLPNDFKSYFMSIDLGDRNLPGSGGIGLIMNQDNEGFGFIRNFTLGLNLSVRIPITSFMSAQVGIKAAFLQKKINWDDLVFSDQLSEKYGNIYNSGFIHPDKNIINMPDFAAGGILQFANESGSIGGVMGFAVDHIFQPNQSFLVTAEAPLKRKWVFHGDVVISAEKGRSNNSKFDSGLKFNPGFIYQNQAGWNSVEVGINLTKFNVYLGGWYRGSFGSRTSSAIVIIAGYRYFFTDEMSLKFAYSYDIQMAGALLGTGGAHEITLILGFDQVSLFGETSSSRSSRGSGGRSRRYGEPLECVPF